MAKNKGGRPRKEIDWNKFDDLCKLQCTLLEMCSSFDVDSNTLELRIREKYNKSFSEIFRLKRGTGKISLRRTQWQLAEKSPAMAIFLGKNMLKQSDIPIPEEDTELKLSVASYNISKIYTLNYFSCNDQYNITINRGGTSSTKTISLAQLAMDFLFTGMIGNKKGYEFDIVSKTLPNLKGTALKEFWKYADIYGFSPHLKHHKSDKTISYGGRTIYYYSIDDMDKVKGRRRDFLWLSESDSIQYDLFRQLQMRTNLHTFLDFNPDNEFIWINEELEQKRSNEVGDVFVVQSSYLDNPFLNDKIIKEIEILRSDAEYWQIFGLGNYGSVAGLIFKDWKTYDELPEKKLIKFYGQDYGFSNSQDAMIEMNWEVGTKNLFLKEKYYELGLGTGKLISKTKEANPDNEPTYGDCVEARLMKDIRAAGVNLFKPRKAVLSSINLLRSFDLFIEVNSFNLLKEFKHYKWMKENGKRINKPLKFLDHLIDAARYGITGFMAQYGSKYKILKTISSKKNV